MVKKGKWTTPGYDEKFGSKFFFYIPSSVVETCAAMRLRFVLTLPDVLTFCLSLLCVMMQTFRPSNRTLPNRCGILFVLQLRRTAVPALQSDY